LRPAAEALRARPARGRLRPLPGARPHRPDGGGVAEGDGAVSVEVAGTARAKAEGPLKLAVPRGALLEGTLDALDAVGIDTSAVRGGSRALIFPGEQITLV